MYHGPEETGKDLEKRNDRPDRLFNESTAVFLKINRYAKDMMTIVYKKNCELKIIQCGAGYEYTDTPHPSERGEEVCSLWAGWLETDSCVMKDEAKKRRTWNRMDDTIENKTEKILNSADKNDLTHFADLKEELEKMNN